MWKENGSEIDLLRYYAQNMSTHATIIIAIVFGLFSVLRIALDVEVLGKALFAIIFFSLAVLGHYEIQRYIYYGGLAKQLADELFKNKLKRKETEKTWLDPIFRRWNVFYWLFVAFSFIGVYIPDIVRLLCSFPKSLL